MARRTIDDVHADFLLGMHMLFPRTHWSIAIVDGSLRFRVWRERGGRRDMFVEFRVEAD